MTQTSPKIVFFGNERLSTAFDPHGAPTLETLLAHGYQVVAVVSNFEPGRSRKQRKLEIADVAQQHNIPLLLPERLKDITETLADFQADCGVLVAYGKMVPQNIIDLFPHGIINIHPSLLPLYRGSIPIEQAILDGATQTGVSLMQLVKAMDAGPTFAQTTLPLLGNETKEMLTKKLLELGNELLIKELPSILADTATLTPQNEAAATYTSLLRKQDGQLDTTKPAAVLERQVRAFAGWPKSSITLQDAHSVIVTQARVARDTEDGTLIINCQGNTYLELLEVVAPSGRRMSGADFLRGYTR